MKNFTAVHDVNSIQDLVNKAKAMKSEPLKYHNFGAGKTVVLLFFNPSLRTRLSTEKAAYNLGMSVMTMNATQGWKLEFEEQVVMNADKAEHIKEAAQVISQYADVIGMRSFPSLTDQAKDYQDELLNKLIRYASVPVLSLESAIRHPLQSLTDALTISEYLPAHRPKVVLTWSPHPRQLPQAVANSFAEWMTNWGAVDLTIVQPEGFELKSSFTQGATIVHDQKFAFEGADFVYAKNWSSYVHYGATPKQDLDWMITPDKMSWTNNGKFMHCLPVRRNVVVSDAVLDSAASLAIQQANNRTYAAQAVLHELLS
ncbi:MAG: N-acetylornithine carbamoyltransferase [Bacteroidota bacterium]